MATLEKLKPIKGRYTYLSKLNKKIIIDSAHTPASFKNILKCIRSVDEFKKKSLKLITVFGCGGERDTLKREEMGKIVEDKSHFQNITNDNPRNEDPDEIIRFISENINYDKMFKQLLKKKLELFYDCLSWDEPTDKAKTIERFFWI